MSELKLGTWRNKFNSDDEVELRLVMSDIAEPKVVIVLKTEGMLRYATLCPMTFQSNYEFVSSDKPIFGYWAPLDLEKTTLAMLSIEGRFSDEGGKWKCGYLTGFCCNDDHRFQSSAGHDWKQFQVWKPL